MFKNPVGVFRSGLAAPSCGRQTQQAQTEEQQRARLRYMTDTITVATLAPPPVAAVHAWVISAVSGRDPIQSRLQIFGAMQ